MGHLSGSAPNVQVMDAVEPDPLLSETEHRYALLGLDIVNRTTQQVESFKEFTRDEIDLPGYVESVENGYQGTDWTPVRVWRTHTSPAVMAEVAELVDRISETAFPAALRAERIRSRVTEAEPLLHDLLRGVDTNRGKNIGHDLMNTYSVIIGNLDAYGRTSGRYRDLLTKIQSLLT
jgi:hypothetical protein